MPITRDQERVELNPFGWSSIVYSVAGIELFGVTSIGSAWKRERVYGYGLGKSHGPRSLSKGKVTYDPLKLKMHKDSFEVLRNIYAERATDGRSFADVRLNHSIQIIEVESFNTVHYLFENVVWSGESFTWDESPDPLQEEAELQYMRCRINGLTPWDSRPR
jgi:hypothetical protein